MRAWSLGWARQSVWHGAYQGISSLDDRGGGPRLAHLLFALGLNTRLASQPWRRCGTRLGGATQPQRRAKPAESDTEPAPAPRPSDASRRAGPSRSRARGSGGAGRRIAPPGSTNLARALKPETGSRGTGRAPRTGIETPSRSDMLSLSKGSVVVVDGAPPLRLSVIGKGSVSSCATASAVSPRATTRRADRANRVDGSRSAAPARMPSRRSR